MEGASELDTVKKYTEELAQCEVDLARIKNAIETHERKLVELRKAQHVLLANMNDFDFLIMVERVACGDLATHEITEVVQGARGKRWELMS